MRSLCVLSVPVSIVNGERGYGRPAEGSDGVAVYFYQKCPPFFWVRSVIWRQSCASLGVFVRLSLPVWGGGGSRAGANWVRFVFHGCSCWGGRAGEWRIHQFHSTGGTQGVRRCCGGNALRIKGDGSRWQDGDWSCQGRRVGYRTATSPMPMAFVICPIPITPLIPSDAFAGIAIIKALLPWPFAVAVPSNCRGLFQ